MSTCAESTAASPVFPATRWTLILDLRGGDARSAGRALEELCRLYWYPVYAFIRRQGAGPEDAEDLTQGFFARLLERGDFLSAEQEKGRLRSFLLAGVKNHMVQDWRHRTAEKRGGTSAPLSLNAAEERYALEPADSAATPDAVFDRRWALDTLEESLRRLEAEYAESGKSELFTALQPFISARPQGAAYEALGPRFQMTAGAVQVAVHRLRQRFRKSLEAVVGETVAAPDEVEGELRHLITLLAG
jgi:DNA-directed RNA polymerase specialized sigma24 family protein